MWKMMVDSDDNDKGAGMLLHEKVAGLMYRARSVRRERQARNPPSIGLAPKPNGGKARGSSLSRIRLICHCCCLSG